METKICSKCKIIKSISGFGNDKSRKSGLNPWCKQCKSIDNKKYRTNKSLVISKNKKTYYKHNKQEILTKCKQYYQNHKESKRKYREVHKEEIANRMKNYYQNNKETLKKYYQENKIERQKYNRDYHTRRIIEDLNYKILITLRARVRNAIKKNYKRTGAKELLGCSIVFLKNHIEKQFTKGMTWKNHGKGWGNNGYKEWHIDHIKPCASFDLSKASEQRKCFHYSNLQPLWAKDNLKKKRQFNESIITK